MENKSMKLKGRAWVLLGPDGKLIDDIDTDMIFHNAYLAITDIEKMGQYAFDNLDGYKEFAKEAKPGDIVIAGKNFGSGSSRQQAVDCFASLGVTCIICESYGAIYKRNAINSGFPILTIESLNVTDPNAPNYVGNMDEVEVDLDNATITKAGQPAGNCKAFSKVQMDIYHAGNLFLYGKTLE